MTLPPTLPERLAQLETAGLIRLAAAAPELAYIFRHALTRDAAYNSLLHSQRRAVHRAAGEALEAMCGTPALRASAAPLLAEHLAQAGEPASGPRPGAHCRLYPRGRPATINRRRPSPWRGRGATCALL